MKTAGISQLSGCDAEIACHCTDCLPGCIGQRDTLTQSLVTSTCFRLAGQEDLLEAVGRLDRLETAGDALDALGEQVVRPKGAGIEAGNKKATSPLSLRHGVVSAQADCHKLDNDG